MSIDPDFAAELARELPPEDFIRVLELFREDMTRLAEVMRIAAAASDAATFRRAAHGLAGAAGTVGAKELEAACRLAMGRHDVIHALAATAGEIERLAAATMAELERTIARARAS